VQTPPTTCAGETLVIMDDKTWIWGFVKAQLVKSQVSFVWLPSKITIQQSWQRFKDANHMIIHWESPDRNGGAIIEEILATDPHYDVAGRIVVLTTHPTHEDVVYFAELGLRKILRVRQRDFDMKRSAAELATLLLDKPPSDKAEALWQKIQRAVETLGENEPEAKIAAIEKGIFNMGTEAIDPSARLLDALGSLALARKDQAKAESYWRTALDKNPNHYRTYNHLSALYRQQGKPRDAFALMQKMQALNSANVNRLVAMGEIHGDMNDDFKAENFFKSALARDPSAGAALNGLAELRFRQGNLDESRQLLARSTQAYKVAAKLNQRGIEFVRGGQFEDALKHYTKAQYVLPHQDKGPMLFYNIGLCYARWGKSDMAREFLKIALIKDPTYKKAMKLLSELSSEAGTSGGHGGDASYKSAAPAVS